MSAEVIPFPSEPPPSQRVAVQSVDRHAAAEPDPQHEMPTTKRKGRGKRKTLEHGAINPRFTAEQNQRLITYGLYPEQIDYLNKFLKSITWRLVPAARMADVRQELKRLNSALDQVEKILIALMAPATRPRREARARLQQAQFDLRADDDAYLKADDDALLDSLAFATSIARRAFLDLPTTERRWFSPAAEFIRLINEALMLGHIEHFRNQGKVAPAFMLTPSRRKKYLRIAGIVSDVTGGWNVEEAVRLYDKAENAKKVKKAKRRTN